MKTKNTRKIRIVSDGTTYGTFVTTNGVRIEGITKIEFEPITPNGLILAKLTLIVDSLDIEATEAIKETKASK